MKVWYELARVYLIGLLVLVGFIGFVVVVQLVVNNDLANQIVSLIAGIIFVGLIAPFILGMVFSPDRMIRALEEKAKQEKK